MGCLAKYHVTQSFSSAGPRFFAQDEMEGNAKVVGKTRGRGRLGLTD